MFRPETKEEFFDSIKRSMEQIERGETMDAFEAFDTMTAELEVGYKAMKNARCAYSPKAVARS